MVVGFMKDSYFQGVQSSDTGSGAVMIVRSFLLTPASSTILIGFAPFAASAMLASSY